jgi:hypothetical protein
MVGVDKHTRQVGGITWQQLQLALQPYQHLLTEVLQQAAQSIMR